jgi:hypothetical protein
MKTLNSPKQRILKNNYLKKCTSFYKERKIIRNLGKNMQLGWKVHMLFKVEKMGQKVIYDVNKKLMKFPSRILTCFNISNFE